MQKLQGRNRGYVRECMRGHVRGHSGYVRIAGALATVAIVAALQACGGGKSDSKSASQVAVKVNKDEITVLQVNEQLAHLPAGTTPEQLEPATRRVLGSLVNQQLLVQQAIEHKLDRDPQVLGALEAARLNILAKAYTQRVIAPQAKPTDQEVRKYYADNPALFSERKVYRLQELSIEATPGQEKDIAAMVDGAKSLKQLADYLHEQKIPFSADSGVRAAEQLPLGQLPHIAQAKPGSVMFFHTGPNHASALEVLASQPQPIDDKKATPAIEQYLSNRKLEELAAAEIKRLRDGSKIEYVGDFNKYAGEAPAPAAAAKTDAAPATAAADAQGAAPAGAAAASNEQNKGIAALR
jgi:EpsD family peptidyl-prolyl cis-trans isomerase